MSSGRAYDCIVVGAFRYPAGDASANRLLSLAKTLQASGRTPLVVNDTEGNVQVAAPAGTFGTYEGVDYICLAESRGGRLARLIGRAGRPSRLVRLLRRDGVTNLSWATVASGIYTPGLHLALRRGLGVRTVVDLVECHDPGQFSRGRLDPYFIRHRFTSWFSVRAADRVIVVSSYLQSTLPGRRSAVLPPAVDVNELAAHPVHAVGDDLLRLLYVGTPGGKDLLGVLLAAVADLEPARRSRVRVVLAGATRQQLEASPDVGAALLARADEFLEVLGPVPRTTVRELLAAADFTFLLRPRHRYAEAGFPSKVPESLAAGCPVITNRTSDLATYLHDGVDSIVCATAAPSDVKDALDQALALDSSDLARMSAQARATAERTFHYEVWAGELDHLLSEEP